MNDWSLEGISLIVTQIPRHQFPLELLNCTNGSLVFTSDLNFTSSFPFMRDFESRTKLKYMISSIQRKGSILLVEKFPDVEAHQLLRKKLKPARTDVEIREILGKNQLQPFAIELIATSLNRGVLSLSELTNLDMDRKVALFHLPFQRLWGSINPFLRNLLYFVAYLDPPEARKIWILSYLEWIFPETGLEQLDKDLKSLTELSLLKEISDGSAYKMHKATCIKVLEGLRDEKGATDTVREIVLFLESQNFIPQPPSKYEWQTYIVFPELREQVGEQGLTTEPKPRGKHWIWLKFHVTAKIGQEEVSLLGQTTMRLWNSRIAYNRVPWGKISICGFQTHVVLQFQGNTVGGPLTLKTVQSDKLNPCLLSCPPSP